MNGVLNRLILLLALGTACGVVSAAEDLQPAVNTSAPEHAPAPAAAPATKPSSATATAKATPAGTPVAAAASNVASKSGTGAHDRVELENTQITGNRELPKVMYVVPWKKPELGDFGGRPAKSLLDELLAPVDRDVFKRQNRYFEALQPDAVTPHAGDEK